MLKYLASLLILIPAATSAQSPQTGSWDVTSKVVDFAVPGVPSFLARAIRGKSKAERKRLRAGEGIEALLAPDPKAHCRIAGQRIADGRYDQALLCPQKNGAPMQIARTGTYDATGFAGRATVNGATPRGAVRIVLDQRAVRVGN